MALIPQIKIVERRSSALDFKKTSGNLQFEIQSNSKDPIKRDLPQIEILLNQNRFSEARKIVETWDHNNPYYTSHINLLNTLESRPQNT